MPTADSTNGAAELAGLAGLEKRLSDFSPEARREALEELADRARSGAPELPEPGANVNMHFHTFFSYNADGWSPSRIAWESRKAGLLVAGIVDFDVLDGMDEFLAAADLLGLRAAVGVESRVFVQDYADKVINSPGEPGVAYFMGTGFIGLPDGGTPAAGTLARMRVLARERNETMLARMNAHLGEASIDYVRDVLPLAPSANATERHMLVAYERRAKEVLPDFAARADYWAAKLAMPAAEVGELMKDSVKSRDVMRAKLMKRGGVGYAEPEAGNFPAVNDMIAMASAAGALPTNTWLDGTNPGEQTAAEIVEHYAAKGILAWNLIPDRNWRLKDPDEQGRKVRKLHEIVAEVDAADILLVHGTERNKAGLPFVDDLAGEFLAPIAGPLRDGALALYGHTAMARFAGRPLGGEWAGAAFADARSRNRFYTEVGRLLEPGEGARAKLEAACASAEPDAILVALR
ncbi:MAG: hypothetical protein ACYS9X_17485 [Planctomycetota bacterium]|jgi:hypothetical protein